ncbi:MAG: thioredoxin domain-containing protein [Nanoarchaeota archaeon]|nr:thioredoxin domain-containing protein [Nanoarchaeota archaeon]
MEEKKETVTLEKSTLWMISTFVLLVLFAGFLIFSYTGKSSTGNATAGADTGNGGTGAQTYGDLSVFNDASLFPSLGSGSTTVIEFSDFQCPYCALASGLPVWTSQSQFSQYADLIGSAGKVEDLASQGKLKFIYVSMSFLGQESVYSAQAGLCANEQDKFWEMHDAIFRTSDAPSENTGKYSKANLEIIAKGISGIDTAKFNTCLESDKYASAVQQISQAASGAGVQGTPTFFVNGKQVSASWNALSAAINA